MGLEEKDYPTLFRASDSTAIDSQRNHFRLVKLRVLLLFVISSLPVFLSILPGINLTYGLAALCVLVVLMVVSGVLEKSGFDTTWFRCRAVAESSKAETWAFMAKAEPYSSDLPDSAAEALFIDRLKEIMSRQQCVSVQLAQDLYEGSQITAHMKIVRSWNLKERKDYYLQDRLADQKRWYAKKAKTDYDRSARWSAMNWVFQIGAVIAAVVLLIAGSSALNLVGVMTTSSAGVLYWSHAKTYGELAKSYSLVAQQLSFLEEQRDRITTDNDLSRIAVEAEGLISREHSIWLARRL